MTTVLGDADTGGGERIHSQVVELEKQLRAKSKEKKDVRSLRAKFRDKCVAIILGDPDLAEKRDIPASLWHLVFYSVIEDFRSKIRASASAAAADKSVNLRKLLTDFREFIADATKFYCGLVLRIKKKYGLAQEGLEGGDSEPAVEIDSKRLTYFRRSCYRIFIHLGDLARYKEQNSDGENDSPDWKLPASYYFKAVNLWPATGHPHNQLAVLATYSHNEFLAVYHYFRSLAVDDPFVTARDNLVLLFERNRQQYSELFVKKRPSDVQKKSKSKVFDKKNTKDDEFDVLKTFFIRFVRIHGILFTRTSLETFASVYQECVSDLEKLLALDVQTLEGLFLPELRKKADVSGMALVALQIVAILIYSVPNGSSRSSYADVLQQSTMSNHALTAAFKIVGCFMSSCTKSQTVAENSFMPACLVFLEWLAYKQEWSIGTLEDDKQYGSQAFFWKESLDLLNTVCELEDSGAVDNVSTTALWEDYELRGFTPLLTAQARLDYEKNRSADAGLRLRRFLFAGKSVADLVDTSDKGVGLAFDKDTGRFFIASGHGDRCRDKVASTERQDSVVALEEPAQVQILLEPSTSTSNVRVVEDEDDEVIVFQPAVKMAPASASIESNGGTGQSWGDFVAPPRVREDRLAESFVTPEIEDKYVRHQVQDGCVTLQDRSDFTTTQLRDEFAALGRDQQVVTQDALDEFLVQHARDDFVAQQQAWDEFTARAKPNSVRPPPGFGPIPQRAVSKWMDNYRIPAPPHSLFGTNFGIWSNNIPVPKSTAYPFPGMGVRTLQQVEQHQQQIESPPRPCLQPPQPQPLYGSWNIPDANAMVQQQQQQHLQLQQQQQPQLQHSQQQTTFRPYGFHDPFAS